MSLLIVSGRAGTRGQSPWVPVFSFSPLLRHPWIKLVKLLITASGPQSPLMGGYSSLLIVNVGSTQLTAPGSLSVSRKDCVFKEGVINSIVYASRALSLEGQKKNILNVSHK